VTFLLYIRLIDTDRIDPQHTRCMLISNSLQRVVQVDCYAQVRARGNVFELYARKSVRLMHRRVLHIWDCRLSGIRQCYMITASLARQGGAQGGRLNLNIAAARKRKIDPYVP
jgi:hypothetical protein